MEPLTEALRLLGRESEAEGAMVGSGGIRLAEGCEVCALPERPKRRPGAMRATVEPASRLTRSVEAWSVRYVERMT